MEPVSRPCGGRHATRLSRGESRGFSMIEVLVVIVLFSFALIGLVGLQARAVQTSVAGEDANRAALLANDIASAMWTRSTVNLPAADITAWNAVVADPTVRGLPNGVGTVTVAAGAAVPPATAINIATITVIWRAPHEPAGTVHTYITQVAM